MADESVILPRFKTEAGYKIAFPGSSPKSWKRDCEAVNGLAAELRERGLRVKIVRIDGEKYAEFLAAESASDSSEMRRKFAEQKIANRGYTMSAAALAVRHQYAKTGGRPRKPQKPKKAKSWLTEKEWAIRQFDPEPLIEEICDYAVKNFRNPVFNHVGNLLDLDEIPEFIRMWARSDLEHFADGDPDALFEHYISNLQERDS